MKKKYYSKAVFFDRDGVINYDFGYVYKIKDFKFKKKVFEAIKYLNNKNYLVIIVTNQSGIGRGYYNKKDLKILHSWMTKKIKRHGGRIDDIFFAPYYRFSKKKFSIREKMRRKPNTGMILEAKNKWLIDLKKSFMLGDSWVDKKLAQNSKLKFIKIYKDSDLFKIVFNRIKN